MPASGVVCSATCALEYTGQPQDTTGPALFAASRAGSVACRAAGAAGASASADEDHHTDAVAQAPRPAAHPPAKPRPSRKNRPATIEKETKKYVHCSCSGQVPSASHRFPALGWAPRPEPVAPDWHGLHQRPSRGDGGKVSGRAGEPGRGLVGPRSTPDTSASDRRPCIGGRFAPRPRQRPSPSWPGARRARGRR